MFHCSLLPLHGMLDQQCISLQFIATECDVWLAVYFTAVHYHWVWCAVSSILHCSLLPLSVMLDQQQISQQFIATEWNVRSTTYFTAVYCHWVGS